MLLIKFVYNNVYNWLKKRWYDFPSWAVLLFVVIVTDVQRVCASLFIRMHCANLELDFSDFCSDYFYFLSFIQYATQHMLDLRFRYLSLILTTHSNNSLAYLCSFHMWNIWHMCIILNLLAFILSLYWECHGVVIWPFLQKLISHISDWSGSTIRSFIHKLFLYMHVQYHYCHNPVNSKAFKCSCIYC